MTKYKCTNSFRTSEGKYYSHGNEIYSSEYNLLFFTDQDNFKKIENDIVDDIIDVATDIAIGANIISLASDLFSSDSSSSNDVNFGGGDFGGGGASGDW